MTRTLSIPSGEWGCGDSIQEGCGWVGDKTKDCCIHCDFIGYFNDDFCPECAENYDGDQQACPECEKEAGLRPSVEYEGVEAWIAGEYLIQNPYDAEGNRDYEIWEAAWEWADNHYQAKAA